MKFLNWLFNKKSEIVDETEPVPEVTEEPKLNVGEPVLSFVSLVNSNPRRFKMREKIKVEKGILIPRYSVFDKVTKELFWYEKRELACLRFGDSIDFLYEGSSNPSFLTRDECEYIERNIKTDHNDEAAARWAAIKTTKAKRLDLEARQRLIDIYCPK